jgi:hypothetical protein
VVDLLDPQIGDRTAIARHQRLSCGTTLSAAAHPSTGHQI